MQYKKSCRNIIFQVTIWNEIITFKASVMVNVVSQSCSENFLKFLRGALLPECFLPLTLPKKTLPLNRITEQLHTAASFYVTRGCSNIKWSQIFICWLYSSSQYYYNVFITLFAQVFLKRLIPVITTWWDKGGCFKKTIASI